jgi:beta-lactamase superfamily II metal-dependent hydrolase
MDADMAVNPDDNRFDEGISCIKAGKIDRAIEIFSDLVEKDERNHRAWNAYGVALSQTNQKDRAIHCFEHAILLDPGNKVYERNLSRIKTPPAKRTLSKMKELTPNKRGRLGVVAGIGIVILIVLICLTYLSLSGMIPYPLPKEGVISSTEAPIEPSPSLPTPRDNISIAPEPEQKSVIPELKPQPPLKPETRIHFIDVSQGDAALIQSDGKNLLIDAGPVNSGQRLVEYLKKQNVTTLDMVIASHPYDDHIGGMIDVLDAFDVKKYADNGVVHSSDLYKKVIAAVISDQAVRMIVTAGMKIPFTNNTIIDVIGPYRLTGHPDEDSLVLKVSIGNISLILPGDSSEVRNKATILKLPDHGSDDAIGPLMNVRPQVSIISLGSGNPFGYPRSATLETIQEIGSQVYRTDVNGSIVFKTDGENWTAQTVR